MSRILITYKCQKCNHEWHEEGEGTPYDYSTCPECSEPKVKFKEYHGTETGRAYRESSNIEES